jgi:hypothetical protein
MKTYKFDCHGHNAPAYGCDQPGDNSGKYVKLEELLLSEEVASAWYPASQLPDPGKKKLIYYKNDLGMNRVVVGFYLPEKFQVSDPEIDDIAIYDQETDECYLPEGWYEAIDNWDDYSSVVIHHEVLAWMPLPALPTGEDE